MHETPDEVRRLQQLLDDSRAHAGAHLLSIFDDERTMSADQLVEQMVGVQVLDLATVTAKGEPRVAPVDGLFYRGHFYFGSSPESVRFTHIRARPAVSAAHTRGEELAVIVHGHAREIDVHAPEHSGFRTYLRAAYPDWEEWGAGSPYARIDANRMFTFKP